MIISAFLRIRTTNQHPISYHVFHTHYSPSFDMVLMSITYIHLWRRRGLTSPVKQVYHIATKQIYNNTRTRTRSVLLF